MRIVLDTNVLLYLLAGKLKHTLPTADFFISVITEMELLSYPLSAHNEEETISSFLDDVIALREVTVVELNPEIKASAIALRRQYRLTMPDAIVAATARWLKAELYTNDATMIKIPLVDVKMLELKNRT